MSKEKQNEELVQMYRDLCEIFDEEYEKRRLITPQNTAEKMTAKGYRKQSEWISVDERFPEEGDEIILCTEDGIVGAGRFFFLGEGHYFRWIAGEGSDFDDDFVETNVTHWMPLPEPPEMKGE